MQRRETILRENDGVCNGLWLDEVMGGTGRDEAERAGETSRWRSVISCPRQRVPPGAPSGEGRRVSSGGGASQDPRPILEPPEERGPRSGRTNEALTGERRLPLRN